MSLNTDKPTFVDWYRNTFPTAKFAQPWDWFDKVEKNSQSLRSHLGGITFYKECQIDRGEDEPVPPQEIIGLYTSLNQHIPLFLAEHAIILHHLTLPFYNRGKQKIKWGKYIGRWMKETEQPEATVKAVKSIMSQLGEVWASYASSKVKMYIAISTDPIAFVQIGQLNVDARVSCFMMGGLNEVHKFIIGQTPNAFVGIVSNVPFKIDQNLKEMSIVQRFWGVADPTFKAFHTFNAYPVTPPKIGAVNIALAETFAELTKSAPVRVVKNALSVQGAFYNPNSNISYHDPNFAWDYQQVKFDTDGLSHMQPCMKCGCVGTDYKIEQVELGFYCQECIHLYGWTCDLTGKLTLSKQQGIMHEGRVKHVSRLVFEEQCGLCKSTNLYYLKTDLGLDTAGESISVSYALNRGMKQCLSCERWNSGANKVCGTCRKSFKTNEEKVLT